MGPKFHQKILGQSRGSLTSFSCCAAFKTMQDFLGFTEKSRGSGLFYFCSLYKAILSFSLCICNNMTIFCSIFTGPTKAPSFVTGSSLSTGCSSCIPFITMRHPHAGWRVIQTDRDGVPIGYADITLFGLAIKGCCGIALSEPAI